MSEYKNFIKDFPSRCGDLLLTYEKRSRFHGREVTLMLSIASAGLTIPYERIRSYHPSGDSRRYVEAKKMVDSLLKEKFLESVLAKENEGSWCRGVLNSHFGDPDSWPEMNSPIPLSAKEKNKEVLHHIRNALAHGNIYTLGREISTIIFLSETGYQSGKFNYITSSPDDFCKFLRNWFKFIGQLNLPQEVSTGIISDPYEDFGDVVNV